MEKKELNCACGSCEDCETCSLETETKEESSDEDATDKPKLPVAARDYTNEIDAYMSYLCNGAFGKLYKKDAAPDDEVFTTPLVFNDPEPVTDIVPFNAFNVILPLYTP